MQIPCGNLSLSPLSLERKSLNCRLQSTRPLQPDYRQLIAVTDRMHLSATFRDEAEGSLLTHTHRGFSFRLTRGERLTEGRDGRIMPLSSFRSKKMMMNDGSD